ncbi:MAG TPA: hypothetical protein VJ508_16605, partial [Saprospiraceae bacterium]|nr:hypothetical protein [Saprospiraceae bacterium]
GGIQVNAGGKLIVNTNATANFNSTQTVSVASGGTFTVQSGAVLRAGGGAKFRFTSGDTLLVNGKLVANGTSSSRVTFTSANSTPHSGDWQGIVCSGGGPDTLTYCDIYYAKTGLQLVNTTGTSYMQNDTVK